MMSNTGSLKQVEETSSVSNGKLEDFNWDLKVGLF